MIVYQPIHVRRAQSGSSQRHARLADTSRADRPVKSRSRTSARRRSCSTATTPQSGQPGSSWPPHAGPPRRRSAPHRAARSRPSRAQRCPASYSSTIPEVSGVAVVEQPRSPRDLRDLRPKRHDPATTLHREEPKSSRTSAGPRRSWRYGSAPSPARPGSTSEGA